MNQRIQQKTAAIKDEVIAIRHHLHAYPELSFQETNTSQFIQDKLRTWGIPFEAGIAGTGIVALIEAPQKNARCIALRADMDALPITELNDVPYKSQNQGVMHACGHDVHTSVLLGTAKILQELRAELTHSVKLIFQPGEEKLPGGANLMIQAGVLENPKVERIYALHVFPEMDAGNVGLKSGMYMASCDEIYMTIQGKGGHAAMPKLNVDPILITSRILLALQEIPGKLCPKDVPCVLAFGRIEGLGATNVIPDKVELQGTFRTMDEAWRTKAHTLIEQTAAAIATENKGNAVVKIERGYPYLENNPELTEKTRKTLQNLLGTDHVTDLPLRMTGEDFSFFAQKIPATFIRLGVRNEARGIVHAVHNARFDIDESALQIGIQAFLAICLDQNV